MWCWVLVKYYMIALPYKSCLNENQSVQKLFLIKNGKAPTFTTTTTTPAFLLLG